MNTKNREVMRKILYAVETGGQVYGQQDYSDFTEAYTNSDAEHAITIGAGAWYATEAKRLLMLIRETYPEKFAALDTAGVGKDLDTAVWSTYKLAKTSEKAKCIQKIISSPEGIKCQDALMEQQIQEYDQKITEQYGSMPDGAMMECINIIHQGGSGALNRILAKTTKPYTADTIYVALCTDPDDKSNNNQVGDYTTRQKKVYEMIKKYCVEDMEPGGVTAEDVLNVMRSWLGYSEANGKYKEIIDLYNSHKPLARGYAVQYDDEWCDTTVSAAAIKAGAVDLIGTECGCEEHVKIFKQKGIWIEDGTITPQPGDIILFNWDNNTQPNDGYSDHIGFVESVSGRTITTIEGNKSQAVGRRTLTVGAGNIRGYARPKYSGSSSGGGSTSSSSSPKKSVSEIADEVIAGKWGNGNARKNAITAAGYNYSEVQAAVNAKLSGSSTTTSKKSNAEIAKEVIAGKWGNGTDRKKKLEAAGYNYMAIQAEVNKQLGKSGSSAGTSGGSSKPSYSVGKTYTLLVDAVRVRTGAGTGNAQKSYSQLTANARANAYSNGCLKKGTQVTCQSVQNVGNDVWIKIPSGWIAAYYGGSKYVG